jgi:hypothetical protein
MKKPTPKPNMPIQASVKYMKENISNIILIVVAMNPTKIFSEIAIAPRKRAI